MDCIIIIGNVNDARVVICTVGVPGSPFCAHFSRVGKSSSATIAVHIIAVCHAINPMLKGSSIITHPGSIIISDAVYLAL